MKARIRRDTWNGWEVQFKRWWWPFWYGCNTHCSYADAEAFAKSIVNPTYIGPNN